MRYFLRVFLVFSCLLALASCRTTPQEVNWMRAWPTPNYDSAFITSIQVGEVQSNFLETKFEDALNASLSSFRLLAIEPKPATHTLNASLTEVETDQEERKVTSSVKINYQLVELRTGKTVMEKEIETQSEKYAKTDRSLAGEAGVKTLLFLMAPLEILTNSAMGNSLELSTEKAHREATEAAVSKNFAKFIASLKK